MDYPEEQHSNLSIFCWVRMHKEEDDGAQKLRHPLFIISIYSTYNLNLFYKLDSGNIAVDDQ